MSAILIEQLPPNLRWVNTQETPDLSRYLGKVVLLHFWTASSVACELHLGDIRRLESKFHDGLVVLGVHTPKLQAEADDGRLLKTLARWYIRHPVVNDREYELWRRFGIQSWPSTVLLDHQGMLAAVFPGVGRRAEIEEKIQSLLDAANEKDERNYDQPPSVSAFEARGVLRFPTRVVASDSFLYVADTGYNRILELSFEGRINRQFGSGNPGHWDARGTEAGFRDPVGLALGREHLFVADTGNHVIRRIRLMTGEVETLAGTGQWGIPRGTDFIAPRTVPLAMPTDLAMLNDRLYIAMAGLHQIWQYDLGRNVLSVIAGTGREDATDGSGAFAAFSQPSGLAVAKDMLYVLCAGDSTLRSLRLYDGRVSTLVTGNMFEVGSSDGALGQARLAHAEALCLDAQRGVLWIADSLNDKLRVYGLAKAELKTLNANYKLQSPSGICLAQNAVWITNTDAHELLKLDLKTGRLGRVAIEE